MINLILKIASAILTLFIIIVSYGIISWNVFNTPTFMSGGKDCNSTIYSDLSSVVAQSEKASSFFRDGSMFGLYCKTN